MKRFRKKDMRLLLLLLSLVLAAGLVQANMVTASAAPGNTYSFTHAYDCQRYPAFPKAGNTFQASIFRTPLDSLGSHISGGINDEYDWKLISLGNYGSVTSPSGNLTSIVDKIAKTYGVEKNNVEVFQLTKDGVYVATGAIFAQSSELTAFLGDNWNADGSTYLLSNSALTDPTTVTISRDVTTGFEPPAPVIPKHIHSWQITGDNTNTLTAACVGQQGTCDAGGPVSVSIAASGVTLPTSPFNASVSNAQQFEDVTGLKVHPLDSLGRPGYKFKAVGASSFADPDMNSPKAGTYQASIYVEDPNGLQHSAFVQYQAIDPVQTAATGDNRPIEIMLLGLLACSAMAVAAFLLDSKRRVSR